MKCTFQNDYILIYIQKSNITEESFDDLSYIEDYFKEIFSKIREKYGIDMNGFYFVNVYIDPTYGIILEIKEEQLEFIEYYDDAIDMKISLHQETFLYKLKDILDLQNSSKENFDIYYYQNEWYIKPKNDKNLYQILEYTEPIYKGINRIIKYGKKM